MLFFSVCQRLTAYLPQNPPQVWSCSPQVWPSSWWWSQVVLGSKARVCRLPAVPLPPERRRSRRGTAQCRPGPGPPGHRRQCRRKPAFPRPVRAGSLPERCGRCPERAPPRNGSPGRSPPLPPGTDGSGQSARIPDRSRMLLQFSLYCIAPFSVRPCLLPGC